MFLEQFCYKLLSSVVGLLGIFWVDSIRYVFQIPLHIPEWLVVLISVLLHLTGDLFLISVWEPISIPDLYLCHNSDTTSNHSCFGLGSTHTTQTRCNKNLEELNWVTIN